MVDQQRSGWIPFAITKQAIHKKFNIKKLCCVNSKGVRQLLDVPPQSIWLIVGFHCKDSIYFEA